MSNSTAIIEHGIGNNLIVPIKAFDGSDTSKLTLFKQGMTVYLFEKGISLPLSKTDDTWLKVNQLHYGESAQSCEAVTAATLADPNNYWMIQSGYVIR